MESSCKADYKNAIYPVQPRGPRAAMGEKVVKILNGGKFTVIVHASNQLIDKSATDVLKQNFGV